MKLDYRVISAFVCVLTSLHVGCHESGVVPPSDHKTPVEPIKTDIRHVERVLLRAGENRSIEHTFTITPSHGIDSEYDLQSKSCGCLGDIPEQVIVSPESSSSVSLRSTVRAAVRPVYHSYNAVYANKESSAEVRLFFDCWAAPHVEIRPTNGCDGRVIWLSDDRLDNSIRLVLRSHDSQSLLKPSVSILCDDYNIETNVEFDAPRISNRTEFPECHGVVYLRSAVPIASERMQVPLRLVVAIGSYEEELNLQLRRKTPFKSSPSSVFFKSGTPAEKVVVVRADSTFRIRSGTVTCGTVKVIEPTTASKVHQVKIAFDGCTTVSSNGTVDLTIDMLEQTHLQIPVHFLGSTK